MKVNRDLNIELSPREVADEIWDMTSDEQASLLNNLADILEILDTIPTIGEQVDALEMAIEALEQITGKLNNPDDSLLTADSEICKEQKSKLDLISREEAIEAIELVGWYHQNSNKDMVSGANSDEHQAWYKADDVYKALEAVPSANRPRGYWKHNTTYKSLVFCSECDMPYEAGMTPRNFCPNCGSDMRGDNK